MKEFLSKIFSEYIQTLNPDTFAKFTLGLIEVVMLIAFIRFLMPRVRKLVKKTNIEVVPLIICELSDVLKTPTKILYENDEFTFENALIHNVEYLRNLFKFNNNTKTDGKGLIISANDVEIKGNKIKDCFRLDIIDIIFEPEIYTKIRIKVTNISNEDVTIKMGMGDKTISKWFKLEVNSKKELDLHDINGKENFKYLKLTSQMSQE
ncbi:hypothetical protein [Fusibacter bizertensis]